MSRSLDRQKTYSFVLHQQKKEILRLWEKRVRQASSAASEQTSLALLNRFSTVLDQLAVSFSHGSFHGSSNHQSLSMNHGRQRAALHGYTLRQVLSEYRILRGVIVEVLEEKGGSMHRGDLEIIASSIEESLISAGSEFMLIGLEAKDTELSVSHNLVLKLEEERKLREFFVAALTHDLRSPLTAAKLGIQLVLRKTDDPNTVLDWSSKALLNIDRANSMIDDLLNANRIQAGEKLNFKADEFDLAPTLKQVTEEVGAIYGDRFVLHVPKTPLIGFWNRGGLRRVIENLLVNAVKYGDPTTPVTLQLKEADTKVKVSIHNEGSPIRPEDQATLFDQFRRTKSAQASGMKGWGLGLTLVRGIIEVHGGHVTVESEEKKGTTFTLTFPKDARPYLS